MRLFLIAIISTWLFACVSQPAECQTPTDVAESKKFVRWKFLDQLGNPLVGGKVSLAFFTERSKEERVAIERHRSDADGVLSIPVSELKGVTSVWVQRRGFISIREDIYDQVDRTISLEPAPVYKGIVVDSTGKPVPNAKVYGFQMSDDFIEPGEGFDTDHDGRFSIPWKTNAAHFMATDGKGNFAQLTNAVLEESRLELRPSKGLEVEVQDGKGNQLDGVSVEIRSWNRCGCVRFSDKTNDKGLATFENVPVGKLGIFVTRMGFRPLWLHADSSGNDRVIAKLKRPQNISIRAVDETTEQPIANFWVTGYFTQRLQVIETGPEVKSQLPRELGWGLQSEQGVATMVVERSYETIALELRAEEYHIAKLKILDSDEETIKHVVKLRRREEGRNKIKVLAVNGTPAQDACVMIQGIGHSSLIEPSSKVYNILRSHEQIRFSNAEGIASLEEVPFEGFLLAWNSEGYFQGQLEGLDISAPIQLEPYGICRLRLPRFLYSDPQVQLIVSVSSNLPSRFGRGASPSWLAYRLSNVGADRNYHSLVDENGQIEIKLLPAETGQIHIRAMPSSGSYSAHPLIEYSANSGQAIELDLTGNATLRGNARFDWGANPVKRLRSPVIYATVEGEKGRIQFQAPIRTDGSFEFSQIPHGEYQVAMARIQIDDEVRAPNEPRTMMTATFSKTVNLIESEDYDLGQIVVPIVNLRDR